MTIRISARDARGNFADLVNRAAYGRERIVISRQSKDLVAVISLEDLELLEELEDQLDIAAARKAIAEAKEKGEKPILWEEAKKDL